MLPAIALSILGGFGTYFVALVSSGGGRALQTGQPVPMPPPPARLPPPVPIAVVANPPPAGKQAPVETKPPPPPPPPPPDTHAALPTPPVAAPPVVLPPVVITAPKPAPVAVPAPVPAPVAKPAPVETKPPPPPPPPPPDMSAELPTPPPPPRLVPDGPTIDVPVGDKYADAAARATAPRLPVSPSTPAGTQPPAGFDGMLASTLAPRMAAQLRSKGYDYNRAELKAWQTAAGLEPDGIYGNDSWGALLFFTSDAPKALFKPSEPSAYPWAAFVTGAPSSPRAPVDVAPAAVAPIAPPAAAPAPPPDTTTEIGPVPPAGFDPVKARKMAKQVANNIDTKKSNYSRDQLTQFQRAAGIDADGIYGGGTRRALIFYGVPRPPTPLFKPTTTPPTYPWEAQASGSQA